MKGTSAIARVTSRILDGKDAVAEAMAWFRGLTFERWTTVEEPAIWRFVDPRTNHDWAQLRGIIRTLLNDRSMFKHGPFTTSIVKAYKASKATSAAALGAALAKDPPPETPRSAVSGKWHYMVRQESRTP